MNLLSGLLDWIDWLINPALHLIEYVMVQVNCKTVPTWKFQEAC